MAIFDTKINSTDLDSYEESTLQGYAVGGPGDQLWLAKHIYTPNDNKRTLVGRAGDPNALFDLSEPTEPEKSNWNPKFNTGGHVERSGSLGNNMGAISVQTPYIIINRPNLSMPDNYGHYHGYPSNITRKINTLKGYTKVSDIHLDGIGGTSTELVKLERDLYNGFIIGDAYHSDPAVFTLYKNNNDINYMNKSLTTLTTCSDIKLKEPTNIVSPTFILSGINTSDIIDTNYLYYPEFKRYYFIKDKTSTNNDLWELHCEVDVLETFRAQVGQLEAVIQRQENMYNLYLDDGSLKAYSNPMVQTKKFPVSFNDFAPHYVMVVLGQ